jgi:hypothetical protein
MKMTGDQRKDFNEWFKIHSDNLKHEINTWQEAQLEILDNHDFGHNMDFKDFALQSLLHTVKQWHDINNSQRVMMNEVKYLINPYED